MLIEALQPLTIRWPGGEIRLEPGKPVELPDERAGRLLERAGNRVRVFQSTSPLTVTAGAVVVWMSPFFGEVRGEVLAVRGDGNIEVFNSLREGLATISLSWVVRVVAPC